MFEAIQPLDNAVSQAIQQVLFHTGKSVFSVITLLGHPAFWLLIATLLYWSNREKTAFFLVNLLVFSSSVAGILKVTIARPRPTPLEFKTVSAPPLFEKLERSINFSFPSGHATTISTIVSYYSSHCKKNSLVFLGIIVVLLVGLSRIVLGKHFLSDVIAGIIIGIILGRIAWKTQQALEQYHFRLTKLKAEAGLVGVLLLALIVMLFVEQLAFVVTLLGFYAGFFLGKERDLRQTPLGLRLQLAKTMIGLMVLGLVVFLALVSMQWLQFASFFVAGFWVSFLYPWLFEKTIEWKTKNKTNAGF